MDIVTARVTHVVHSGPIRHVLHIGQRKGVQIGPQGNDPLTGTDITDQPVTGGEHAWLEAGRAKFRGDQRGRVELLPGELGMGVDTTAKGYEFCLVRGEPAVESTRQRGLRRHRFHGSPRHRRCRWRGVGLVFFSAPCSSSERQRTGHSRISFSIDIINAGRTKPSARVTERNII
jgi:hypothetical protein